MTEPTSSTPVYPEESRANRALLLAALGVPCLLPFAAVGFWTALSEQRAIDEGRRDPAMRSRASLALGLGAFGLITWGLVLVTAFLIAGINFAAG